MTDWLTKLESRGDQVARFAALAGMVFLVALALMTITDVLMRWLFNAPIDGVADVGPLVVAIVVASTFPLTISDHHNVTINFLGNWLGRRGRARLELLAAIITTVFFVLLAWQFVLYVVTLDSRGQTTWVLRWPVAPWWAVVAFFMVVSAVMQLIVLILQFMRTSAEESHADTMSDQHPQDETPSDGGF